MKGITIVLFLCLYLLPLSTGEEIQAPQQNQQQENVKEIGYLLPLEAGEELLDYRYLHENKIEVFTKLGDQYYRTFYNLKDEKVLLIDKQAIELPKSGLKTK